MWLYSTHEILVIMIGLSLSYITYALCMLKGSFLEGDSAAQFHTGLNIEEKVNYSYNDYRIIDSLFYFL